MDERREGVYHDCDALSGWTKQPIQPSPGRNRIVEMFNDSMRRNRIKGAIMRGVCVGRKKAFPVSFIDIATPKRGVLLVMCASEHLDQMKFLTDAKAEMLL